jgi:hypothetical protein
MTSVWHGSCQFTLVDVLGKTQRPGERTGSRFVAGADYMYSQVFSWLGFLRRIYLFSGPPLAAKRADMTI